MPLIPLSGPISMSMLNTAVARSATTANSLLANGATPANPGLFYLGYQINNSLNQTAPHAMSEWYGFDTTTTTTTTTSTTTTTTTATPIYYYVLEQCFTSRTYNSGATLSGSLVEGKVYASNSPTGSSYYRVTGFVLIDPSTEQASLTTDTGFTSCASITTTTTTAALPTLYSFATGSTSSSACSNWENPALRVGYYSNPGNITLDIGDYLYKNSGLTIGADAGYYGGPDAVSGGTIKWFNIASGGQVIDSGSCDATTTTTTSTTTTTTTVLNYQYTMTRCDVGGSYTWIVSNSLNISSVYTDVDPTGAPAGSRACYTIVSDDGTTSSPTNKTAFLVSGGCGDSVCIL